MIGYFFFKNLSVVRSFGRESSSPIEIVKIAIARSVNKTIFSMRSIDKTSVIVDHFFACNRDCLNFTILYLLLNIEDTLLTFFVESGGAVTVN